MKIWVGRCNRCGAVRVVQQRRPAKGGRRCTHGLGTPVLPCGGYLHGLRGDEKRAAEAAFRVGGVEALSAMFGASVGGSGW